MTISVTFLSAAQQSYYISLVRLLFVYSPGINSGLSSVTNLG